MLLHRLSVVRGTSCYALSSRYPTQKLCRCKRPACLPLYVLVHAWRVATTATIRMKNLSPIVPVSGNQDLDVGFFSHFTEWFSSSNIFSCRMYACRWRNDVAKHIKMASNILLSIFQYFPHLRHHLNSPWSIDFRFSTEKRSAICLTYCSRCRWHVGTLSSLVPNTDW